MRTKITALPTRPAIAAKCERWLAIDLEVALYLHAFAQWRWLQSVLAVSSRLGNGIVWYTLAAAMPFLAGPGGIQCAEQMIVAGTLNLLIYRQLKHRTGRERPFAVCSGIKACTNALDRFSFPSGHTLHAVAFSLILGHHYPTYAPLLWSFASLVALSRVVLGLHYPTDVAAGAVIGLGTGWLVAWHLFL